MANAQFHCRYVIMNVQLAFGVSNAAKQTENKKMSPNFSMCAALGAIK